MRNSRVVKVRAGAVLEVIRSAAAGDPDIGALWARIQTEFHANQRAVVQSLADKGALKADLDVEAAADILWASTTRRSTRCSPASAAGRPSATSSG